MDAASLKANQHKTWTAVAPGWRKHDAILVARTAPVTLRMIENLRPGQRVLDIACGTGEPSQAAAERVGPTGSVLATDFVDEMLAFAREKASVRGLGNVDYRKMDGELLEVAAASFDAVTMRWGLMFMPDPVACLRRAHAALKPGGSIALTCWAAPAVNPWASMPTMVLKRHMEVPTPPPEAPGLFAFADGQRLERTLVEAGFADVVVEEVGFTMAEFESGKGFFDYTMELAGPIAMLLAQLPADKQAVARREIEVEAEKSASGKVRLGGVTWLARGRA